MHSFLELGTLRLEFLQITKEGKFLSAYAAIIHFLFLKYKLPILVHIRPQVLYGLILIIQYLFIFFVELPNSEFIPIVYDLLLFFEGEDLAF